jgi:hypothetical protein
LTPTRLCFNARGHDRLASIREHDNVPGFEVRRKVFEVSGGGTDFPLGD